MKGFWKPLVALLLCSTPFTMCKEKEEVRIEAQAVKLDKSTLTLTVGEMMQLKAEVTPKEAADKTVVWESSAPAVATVENGKVTAKGEGTAEVTAKCGKAKATCSITVKAKVIPVESVTLDKTEAELSIGETLKLMASVMPKEAPQTIVWTSSNPEVASVNEGEITAIAKGNTTITAQAGEKVAKCAITVKPDLKFKMTISDLGVLDGIYKIESPDPDMTYMYTVVRKAICDDIEARHGDLIKANLAYWENFPQAFKVDLMKGTQEGKLSDEVSADLCLWPDTEYVFYAFGINEKKEITAPLQKHIFRTKPSTASGMTIGFDMKSITPTDLLGTIKPSTNGSYYITMQRKNFVNFYKRKTDAGEKIDGLAPMHAMIFKCLFGDREAMPLEDLLHTGNLELTEGYFKNKKPNTEYVLIMVGMDVEKGLTTEPFLYEFKTAKAEE